MSRILRRPMFRGGPASSDGVGITSGLNNPRQGYADGPDDEGVQPSVFQNIYDYVNPSSDTVLNRLKSNQEKQTSMVPDSSILQSIYDVLNPSNETIVKRLQQRQEEQKEPIIKTQAYREEQKKIAKDYEAKIAAEKTAAERAKLYSQPEQNILQKNALPTLGQDIDTYTKLLMENAGPDKDEYTRQKYLTLAKFGLNLLKPTPVGIKPSLATSIASAAEKPLEEYGNISMQQSKEERALKQAAAQMAFQKHMPGPLAKTVQDIMASDPSITLQDATSRALTGKSLAQQHKEERLSIGETAKRLSENPNLKGLDQKDPATLQLLAKIVEKGVDDTQIKGPIDKYNYPTENSYYTNVINPKTGQREVAHYYKGQYHFIGEPNFIVKPRGI